MQKVPQMAFLPIQSHAESFAPVAEVLPGLTARLRAVLGRLRRRPGQHPETLLASQARRAEARAAADRLLRHPR